MSKLISFPGFTVRTSDRWSDITDDLDSDDRPFTVADPEDGVGALQFSAALYESGPRPNPSLDDLIKMVNDFADSNGLSDPTDIATDFGPQLLGAAASFHDQTVDDLIRIWYLSGGNSFLFVTYICGWDDRYVEIEEVNRIVRSVRFLAPT